MRHACVCVCVHVYLKFTLSIDVCDLSYIFQLYDSRWSVFLHTTRHRKK